MISYVRHPFFEQFDDQRMKQVWSFGLTGYEIEVLYYVAHLDRKHESGASVVWMPLFRMQSSYDTMRTKRGYRAKRSIRKKRAMPRRLRGLLAFFVRERFAPPWVWEE